MVKQVIDQANKDDYLAPKQASDWLTTLRGICTDLFDEYALSELGEQRSMAKCIKARQALTGWLYGGKDIKKFMSDYKIPTKKETA